MQQIHYFHFWCRLQFHSTCQKKKKDDACEAVFSASNPTELVAYPVTKFNFRGKFVDKTSTPFKEAWPSVLIESILGILIIYMGVTEEP